MKKILVLGAGLVAGPLVKYLMDSPEIEVVLAARDQKKAELLVGDSPSGSIVSLNMDDVPSLKEMINGVDLVVSLLPWTFHPMAANLCLELDTNFLTASYVKEEMQALDAKVKEKGLIFLNEIGVDPGIDHMAAMKTINEIKAAGGEVTSFYSYCGGLPAMADNNNPLGYKFSWSPEGALMAAGNDGRYFKDGEIIEVSGDKLFEHYWLQDVPGAGVFEAYVNRDSIPYKEVYDIPTATSIYRGTLRNISHCETWTYFKKLDLFSREKLFDFSIFSPAQVMAQLINSDGKDLEGDLCAFLGAPLYSITVKKLEWLGLLSDDKLSLGRVSLFDMFVHVLKDKLVYNSGEVDLLLQHHEFIGKYPDGRQEKILSTMVDTGIPGGDSSMARTVGLPAAIAARLIVEGKIDVKGVCIPVLPEIYTPVLAELEKMGIRFVEKKISL